MTQTPDGNDAGVIARQMTLTLWTNDVSVAAEADAAGVDRVGIDLERRGKAARQAGRNAWISDHAEDDLLRVAPVLRTAQLFVRIDPLHPGSGEQLERVVERGAQVVMIPMAEDPAAFSRLAAANTPTRIVALIETKRGVEAARDLAATSAVDELHVGPNDLSLSLGLANRFAVLVHDAVTTVAEAAHAAGKPLGVAAIGRVHDDGLPVPSDLVYAQVARLGATATLLGRSFLREGAGQLATDVAAARSRLAEWCLADNTAWEHAREQLLVATHDPLPGDP